MFYFEIDGKTYAIRFFRDGVDKTATFAELLEVNDELVSTEIYGFANLYYKDRFVKSVGRKVALTNLLENLSQPDANAHPLILTKDERRVIWEAYFKTFKK